MATKKTEIQINYAPQDTISSLSFAPESSQYLIASSWDGTVRLYDTTNNNLRQKYIHNCPVLDVAFQVNSNNLENDRNRLKISSFRTMFARFQAVLMAA
jgi:WD40 repeat protein